jgi:hypothetical protein
MKRFVFLYSTVIIALLYQQSASQPSINSEFQKKAVLTNLKLMPLAFTENRGQWNEKALYKAEAGGATFWFCKDEVAYVFMRDTDEPLDDGLPHCLEMPGLRDKFNHPRHKKESLAIHAKFVGANQNTEIVAEDRLSYNCNYFIGNVPEKWHPDVPNYSSITYKDIYPGIDLKYHGNGAGMKYDFIVNPGANISNIKIKYDGVENLTISTNGDLEAATSFGPIHENIPEIYQEIGGSREKREGRYILKGNGIYGFEVDDYNPNYPIVIDPELVYSTYLGGSDGDDWGKGIAVDSLGDVYIVGSTWSTNFPSHDPYQTDSSGADAFLAKFAPSGSSPIYSTYLGGSGNDYGWDIKVDRFGNSFIAGETWSDDFPTQNPYQLNQATDDGFVAKFSATGDSLIYCTYLGGSSEDHCSGIAIDDSGNAYATGETISADFPIQNPYQTYHLADAFVTKFSPDGDSLIYSTYLGGSNVDCAEDIAIDNVGNAYIIGWTYSSDFPLQNPFQGYQGPLYHCDAFVAKLSPEGNSLIYGTYLGGNGYDWGSGIAVDNSGSAYVTGKGGSTDFPLQNPYQTFQGNWDAFVTRFSPEGDSLVFSTLLGGTGEDCGNSIAIDGTGDAYITGETGSANFPTQNPYQLDQPNPDAFMTEFSPSGQSIIYSTYLGGNSWDRGYGIVIDNFGNAYLAGETFSTDFPTQNPFQTYQGPTSHSDAFIAKFDLTTGINDNGPNLPNLEQLSQNYPNPFNAQTQINYAIPKAGHVSLSVFNLLGQEVAILFDGIQNAGEYSIVWNAADMPSGIYFARLEAQEKSNNIKMILLK